MGFGALLLDGNLLIEVGINREVGNAKATLAEDLLDLEPLDLLPGLQAVAVDLGH